MLKVGLFIVWLNGLMTLSSSRDSCVVNKFVRRPSPGLDETGTVVCSGRRRARARGFVFAARLEDGTGSCVAERRGRLCVGAVLPRDLKPGACGGGRDI